MNKGQCVSVIKIFSVFSVKVLTSPNYQLINVLMDLIIKCHSEHREHFHLFVCCSAAISHQEAPYSCPSPQ